MAMEHDPCSSSSWSFSLSPIRLEEHRDGFYSEEADGEEKAADFSDFSDLNQNGRRRWISSSRIGKKKRQKLELERRTELGDLPSSILHSILALVTDVRSRNCAALVSHEWLHAERATRRRLHLRGNVADFYMLPASFHAVRQLDLSDCSPWGGSLFQGGSSHRAVCSQLAAQWLRRAFPRVVDLTVYVRDAVDVRMVACSWPDVQILRLVRWHQRPTEDSTGGESETELEIVFNLCSRLTHLDLSKFYCWTEDIVPAMAMVGSCAASCANLRSLNLLKVSPEGFKATELLTVASACKNLEELLVVCEFDPRFLDSIGDECLLELANCCGNLSTLHLVDSSQFNSLRQDEQPALSSLDANITVAGLIAFFRMLPRLEDLALLLGQNVRDSAPAFEALAKSCTQIQSLQVSYFQGLCYGPQLDGICSCSSLRALSIKECEDLSDSGLSMIARGCSRLSRLGLQGCGLISEQGLLDCVSVLKHSLVDVEIQGCALLPTREALRSLAPLRPTLKQLRLDCIWGAEDDGYQEGILAQNSWSHLENLSLWIPAGQLITPLFYLGLDSCPELHSLGIKVEGDSRLFAKPQARESGLSGFSCFPNLRSLRLDLSEMIGYALSAPGGNRDLSIWERFYINGIQSLKFLQELDYFPPSDKDVNYRGMALPAVGLISMCENLRKLFVHGTAYEHLFMLLLNILNLRDFQMRADYFPTPEMATGTEMRAESCRRFEHSLAKRGFPD